MKENLETLKEIAANLSFALPYTTNTNYFERENKDGYRVSLFFNDRSPSVLKTADIEFIDSNLVIFNMYDRYQNMSTVSLEQTGEVCDFSFHTDKNEKNNFKGTCNTKDLECFYKASDKFQCVLSLPKNLNDLHSLKFTIEKIAK